MLSLLVKFSYRSPPSPCMTLDPPFSPEQSVDLSGSGCVWLGLQSGSPHCWHHILEHCTHSCPQVVRKLQHYPSPWSSALSSSSSPGISLSFLQLNYSKLHFNVLCVWRILGTLVSHNVHNKMDFKVAIRIFSL